MENQSEAIEQFEEDDGQMTLDEVLSALEEVSPMYTREQVLSMEAGRELDDLVAKKVMGWTKDTGSDYWLSQTNRIRTWEQTSYPGFQPSTDIAAAWEVVSKITDKSERDGCGPCVHIEHDGDWHARIGRVHAMADTAPLAICKVALLSRRTNP